MHALLYMLLQAVRSIEKRTLLAVIEQIIVSPFYVLNHLFNKHTNLSNKHDENKHFHFNKQYTKHIINIPKCIIYVYIMILMP